MYVTYKNGASCGHQHQFLARALNCARNTRRGQHISEIVIRRYFKNGTYKVVRT